MISLLRLPDDQPLDSFNVFEPMDEEADLCQEDKARRQWKSDYLTNYFEQYAKNQGQRSLDPTKLSAKVKSTYFMIIDLNLPIIQLNITQLSDELRLSTMSKKDPSIQTFYVNQFCSVFHLRGLVKSRFDQVKSLDDVDLSLEQEEGSVKMDLDNLNFQLRDYGITQQAVNSFGESLSCFMSVNINEPFDPVNLLQKHTEVYSPKKAGIFCQQQTNFGPYSIYQLSFCLKKKAKVPPLKLETSIENKSPVSKQYLTEQN
mmetsp:Transcript_42370/g.65030  ORF Transcript_42370/g.65030 Transcript_42370/m.65030 type:complete len:259 (-) Transcript_42370:1128-1904(-)